LKRGDSGRINLGMIAGCHRHDVGFFHRIVMTGLSSFADVRWRRRAAQAALSAAVGGMKLGLVKPTMSLDTWKGASVSRSI
jgi:hypothetical protein